MTYKPNTKEEAELVIQQEVDKLLQDSNMDKENSLYTLATVENCLRKLTE